MFLALLAITPSILAGDLPDAGAPWELLSQKPVRVECTRFQDKPWCRSSGLVHAPLQQVASALENMRYNADLFDSVVKIDVLDDDTLRVVLDYPSPLDDRDYIAHYSQRTEGEARIFRWVPAVHPAAPEGDEAVRLPAFEGEWRLEPRGEGVTWVRYTWEAEINGSFPSFGYSTAWKRAGHEALRDLAKTQGAELTPAP